MSFFNRLRWRSAKKDVAPVLEVDEIEDLEAFDAATTLLELVRRGEVAEVLRVLDTHLDELEQQGEGLIEWTSWLETQVDGGQEQAEAGQLATLGSIYQRLQGTERSAYCHKALGFYQGAIEAYRNAQADEGVAVLLNNMALLHCELAARDRQRFRLAIPLFEEALEFYENRSELSRRGAICLSLGEAYAGLDEAGLDHCELAKEYYERAWALFERSGERTDQALAQGYLGDIQVDLAIFGGAEQLEKAVRHYRNALSIYVDIGDDASTAHYQECLGRAYAALGAEEHVRKALRVYARARDIQEQRGPQRQAALINLEMARLALGLGASDLALAFECATAALEAFVQSGGDGERARTLCLLAEIYLHAGFESQREDVEQAVRCLTEAQGLFLRLEIADEYHAARDLLTRARGYTCETL